METAPLIFGALAALFIAGLFFALVYETQRHRRRAASLTRDSDTGYYFWVDFDGQERKSDRHPNEPGGSWHKGPAGSGDSKQLDMSTGDGGSD